MITFPGKLVPPMNPQVINQVVGYLEYGIALGLLDNLLNIATPQELAVMEAIVKDREEFTVHTNLSRLAETQPRTLSERSIKANDNFARRGLAWVVALARAELGAITANFTETSEPFGSFLPSRYDRSAYEEILEDSMRTHYWALRNDRLLPTMRKGFTPDPQAIAYARRVIVTLEMLRAVRGLKADEYSVSQYAELENWELELAAVKSYLLYNVLGVTNPMTFVAEASNSVEFLAPDCVVNAMKIDIERGLDVKVSGSFSSWNQLQAAISGTPPRTSPGQNGPSGAAPSVTGPTAATPSPTALPPTPPAPAGASSRPAGAKVSPGALKK
jgi:hypothetical protein